MLAHGEARMTSSGPAVVSQSAAAMSDSEVIDTRFGKVTIHRSNPIIFTNGLLGIPDKEQFCLTGFPSQKLSRFKLLQSLEDLKLSFITLPIDLDNPVVARADLEQAAKDLSIPANELVALLIVSVHREEGATKLSVNARAPIFIHAARKQATQHVFPHTKYDIRHMITL